MVIMVFEHLNITSTLARRERLLALLPTRGIVAIPCGSTVARNYPGNPYAFRANSHFLYLVGASVPDAILIGDLDSQQWTLFAVPPTRDDALWHGAVPSLDELGKTLGIQTGDLATLPRLAGRSAGALWSQHAVRALADWKIDEELQARLVDSMIALRLVHDEAAQEGLARAASATVLAHRAGMRATRAGLREWHVRSAMESALLNEGMGTSYNSIVTVAGEVLHNNEYHRLLRDGDLLLADVGAETQDGYAGDVTRAWPVSGTFSSTQRAIYEVALAAQKATIDAARPGVRYRELHLLAAHKMTEGLVQLGLLRGDVNELVADGVHALFFPHGIGHLLGLDVHDMEDLGDRAGYAPGRSRSTQFGLSFLRLDRDLAEGMCVTIEPGIYFSPAIHQHAELRALGADRVNWDEVARYTDVRGIRIEDDVLITEDACRVLTSAIPKEPGEVEDAMRS